MPAGGLGGRGSVSRTARSGVMLPIPLKRGDVIVIRISMMDRNLVVDVLNSCYARAKKESKQKGSGEKPLCEMRLIKEIKNRLFID